MTQVLCYTGKGFDTCWRPGNVATNMVVRTNNMCEAPFNWVRFQR